MKFAPGTLFLLFSVVYLSTCEVTHAVDFNVQPGDTVAPLNEMSPVIFECEVNDNTPYWTLMIPDYSSRAFLSTEPGHNDNDILNERGITFFSTERFTNISIPRVAENNDTALYCAATNGVSADFSGESKLTIVGPPLPPDPVLTLDLPSELDIQWGIPYSHENFPVESYNIRISSTTSQNILGVLAEVMDYNETSYHFVFEDETDLLVCHNIDLSVSAVSGSGESTPGTVSRNYPIEPQPFESEAEIDVTFLRDGSPIVEISFEAPFICNFQTANYTITIEDLSSSGLPAVTRWSNYTGSKRMILEMFNSELVANRNYTLIVTVVEEHFATQISQEKNFTTIFNPTGPSLRGTSPGDIELREIGIYLGAFGGIILLFLVFVVVLVLLVVYIKRRKPSRAHTREETSDPATMYDTITEYQSNDYRTVSQAERNRLRMLEQQTSERKAPLQGNGTMVDPTYQYMHSARGISRTQFTYHPYTTDQSTTIMMHHSGIEFEPGPPPPTLTNDNFPCPAAAGSSSIPVHATEGSSNLYFPNPTMVGHSLETTVEVNEYDSEEREEEYTVMSPGGTLASQVTTNIPYNSSSGGVDGIGGGSGGVNVEATVPQMNMSGGPSHQFTVMTTEC